MLKVIDPHSTAELFGDSKIVAYLYQILYSSLKEDHVVLKMMCKHNNSSENIRAIIHRIRGGLRYCKAPKYEEVLIELDNLILKGGDYHKCFEDLDNDFNELMQALQDYLCDK